MLMKKKILLILALAANVVYGRQTYHYNIDLNQIVDDKLQVTLIVPDIDTENIIYNIPKIIPGTYSIYDFGKYISEFSAFDSAGALLNSNRIDSNRWEIHQAHKLHKITYWVDDTWDAMTDQFVFEPAGTNIEKENIVLNNHGFFGYFEGMKNHKYDLTVTHPENFYASTGLTFEQVTPLVDKFSTQNYMDLVDAPIMYNVPDTCILSIGGAEILLSVYSKNNHITAKALSGHIKDLLQAQKNYLGGVLPIKKYAFIIYLYDGISPSGASGALEHSYSSFYFLPELPEKRLSDFVVDIAAHEFFHIITPLNIHSEEIGNFDYIQPKMSKHLWLYEGITEYFSGHVQVYENMITLDKYLLSLKRKMKGASYYNEEVAFTEMSLGCLDEHKDQYGNVYQKGALIGLCLDILLREHSNGSMGMKDMMLLLAENYGKEVSFKDEELFDKITSLSYPAIGAFFEKHVEGNVPLPLDLLLDKVGVKLEKNKKIKEVNLGNVTIAIDNEELLYVASTHNVNTFGKKLKYKLKDKILAVNGVSIDVNNMKQVLDQYRKDTKDGDKVEILIRRKGKEKKLKGKAETVERIEKFHLSALENPNPKQLELRQSWIGNKHQ